MHVYKHSRYSAVTQLLYGLKQVILLCCPTQSLSLCDLSFKSKVCSLLHQGETSDSVSMNPCSKFLHRSPSFLSHPPFSLIPVMVSLARSPSSPLQWFFPPHLFVSTFFNSISLTFPATIHIFPKDRSLSLLFLLGSSNSFARPLFPPLSKNSGKSALWSGEPPRSSAPPHATPHASPLLTSALGSTAHADCCRRDCDLIDDDNVIQRSYPVVQEWQEEIFCMLMLSSKGINAFRLSVGIGPNEEHCCMWWTLSTYIQLTLVGFPTSHTSAHVQMPAGSRANTDKILSQIKSQFHELLKTAKEQLWLQYTLAESEGGRTKPRGGFVLLWQHQEWKQ